MQIVNQLKYHILSIIAIIISMTALFIALDKPNTVVHEISINGIKGEAHTNFLPAGEYEIDPEVFEVEEEPEAPCTVDDWECRAVNGMIPEGMEFPTAYTKNGNETAIVIQCMAVAMWAEAREDGDEGMIGIGHAILNRVDQKGRFGFAKTPCSVVLQHAQFEPLAKSTWEYRIVKAARQGNVSYEPKTNNPIDSRAFKRAKHLARQIIYGGIPDITNGATNFYAPEVMEQRGKPAPVWTEKYPFTVRIGGHHYHKAVYFHGES